ncbi:site-specific DNA-methyltransferase [Erysipelothrix rhusiopathiae]|nr:site-specific DNA-methyltransferase [Erysipelothrix rhusiopathiae]MCG4437291.1 site-specific DNA-methyltransferase [Erysipelothrix rhusiopathiae]
MNDKESCLYFRKEVPLTTTYESGKTYWISGTNQKDKKAYNHPTIKPEWIINFLIHNSSKEGDVVLDCFIGSGTTAVCAKRLNRRYIGVEMDPDYHNTAVSRVNDLSLSKQY